MSSRLLRPSQFVTTYGVASLMRIGKLHRIIPSYNSIVTNLRSKKEFSEQDDKGRRGLDKFQIQDKKLEKTIQGVLESNGFKNEISQIKVFKLPSNADLSIPDGEKLYTTDVFPKWSICSRHSILKKLDFQDRKWVVPCSMCQSQNLRLEAGIGMRFIRACPKGHMDDLDWYKEVHRYASCTGDEYDWEEEGNEFEVVCRTCDRKTTYQTLINKSENNALECSAKWPEHGGQESSGCFETVDGIRLESAKLVLKNASHLRLSHVVSSLIIPPFAGRVYKMLSEHGEFLVGFAGEEYNKQDMINKFRAKEKYLRNKGVNEEFFSVLEESSEDEIKKSISVILEELETGSISEIVSEDSEFDQLFKASKQGFPKPVTGEPAEFMVDINKVKKHHSDKFGLDFVVTPIQILHVVKAQVGYRREVKTREESQMNQFMITPTGDLVPTFWEERSGTNSTKWFVGKKIKGEGIFIHIEGQDVFEKKSQLHKEWLDVSNQQNDERLKHNTNPHFVWWHSLAHRLVTDLSIDSGFQSTAIAEKTYFKMNSQNNSAGILLYAVQEGGDGTLGGLTGLVPNFDKIIERSISRLMYCSNDPLCKGRPFNANRVNGAACYACLLISETSCGMQNRFLDRNLLLESIK